LAIQIQTNEKFSVNFGQQNTTDTNMSKQHTAHTTTHPQGP